MSGALEFGLIYFSGMHDTQNRRLIWKVYTRLGAWKGDNKFGDKLIYANDQENQYFGNEYVLKLINQQFPVGKRLIKVFGFILWDKVYE